LELFKEEKIIILISLDILAEVRLVLKRVFGDISDTNRLIRLLSKHAKLIAPKVKIDIVKDDPTDNKLLECAISGRADFIVSGDKKHVLPLKKYKNIPILNPKEFLDTMK